MMKLKLNEYYVMSKEESKKFFESDAEGLNKIEKGQTGVLYLLTDELLQYNIIEVEEGENIQDIIANIHVWQEEDIENCEDIIEIDSDEENAINYKKLEKLKSTYENVIDEIRIQQANGDLGKLVMLRGEFDTTFDSFFDDEELRRRYNAWNTEEDIIDINILNADLEEKLNNEDLEKLIKFYENYIGELSDKLKELKSK